MPESEADAVAEKVKACINLLGVKPQEIAVFYRLNDMSRPIETALARRQIPFKVVGGLSFYDRAEIRDCIAMLRVLSNPKDSAAFARIVNKPKRGIGEKTIGLIENYAHMKSLDLVAACAHARDISDDDRTADAIQQLHFIYGLDQGRKSVADLLAEVIRRTNYHQHLESHEKETPEKIEERKRNVDELVNSIALWCQDEPKATIADYLGYISLLTSGDDDGTDNAVPADEPARQQRVGIRCRVHGRRRKRPAAAPQGHARDARMPVWPKNAGSATSASLAPANNSSSVTASSGRPPLCAARA